MHCYIKYVKKTKITFSANVRIIFQFNSSVCAVTFAVFKYISVFLVVDFIVNA
jgi:hypothetical protein